MRGREIMKKTLLKSTLFLTASALFLSSFSTDAGPYKGFAIGINGGWLNDAIKYNADLGDVATVNSTAHLNQLPVGAHVDYHYSNAQNLYLGIGISGGYNFGRVKEKVFDIAGIKLDLETKRNFYAELTSRIGLSSGNAIVYALLAGSVTKLTTKTIGSVEGESESKNMKKTVWGIAPGMGFDIKLDRNWSLGAEYKYFLEKKIRFNEDLTAKTHAHKLVARLSYHF
jgi:opacity protein-like surface antigen